MATALARIAPKAMAPLSALDRRAAERFPISAPVRWVSGSGTAVNISATGILFETDESLAPDMAIKFTVIADNSDAQKPLYAFCDAVIRRVQPGGEHLYAVAAEFNQIRFH